MSVSPSVDAGADGPSTTDTTTPPASDTSINTAVAELSNPTGKLAMKGCVGFDYFAPFTIGASPMQLLVDSGSTTLAAAASSCTSCAVDAKYTPSAAGRASTRTTSSTYLDGSGWNGNIVTDTATAGPANQAVTPAVSLTFAEITSQRSFFSDVSCAALDDTPFDGIAGFGPDTQLTTGTTSFLTLLHAQNQQQRDAFSLQTCDIGGQLWFGGYDANATVSTPHFTPMLQNRAYAVTVSAMAVGGADMGVSASQIGPMVVDNGTNAILLSNSAYAALERKLEANQAYMQNFNENFISAQGASCEPSKTGLTRAQLDDALPKLAMTFPDQAGGSFTVEAPATSSYLVAFTLPNDNSGMVYYCPAVAASSVGIIGNTFMRSHVVIFDREGKRIGFAPQTGCQKQTVLSASGT